MNRYRLAAVALLLSATIGSAQLARAQQAGYQSLSSPAGYQFAVPAAWLLDTSPGAAGILAGSSDGSDLAYVTVVPAPPPGSTDESGSEVLQGVVDTALSNHETRDGYRVTRAASPTTVAGADSAQSGSIAYFDENGIQINGYVLVAVRGLQAYTLTVLLPQTADAAAPGLAQTILSSFQLTRSPATPPS